MMIVPPDWDVLYFDCKGYVPSTSVLRLGGHEQSYFRTAHSANALLRARRSTQKIRGAGSVAGLTLRCGEKEVCLNCEALVFNLEPAEEGCG